MKEREMLKRAAMENLPDKDELREFCLTPKKKNRYNVRIAVAAACFALLLGAFFTLSLLERAGGGGESVTTPQTTSHESLTEDKVLPDEADHIPEDRYGVPGSFIAYIGEERFDEWSEEMNKGEYKVSEYVLQFVKEFDIPRELIRREYNNDRGYWNIDLMLIL